MGTAAAAEPDSPPGRGGASVPRRTGFRVFYARNLRDVTGLAYTLTGSWAAAEDVAQDAFVRAYRSWDRIEHYARPDSWVRTVAVNLATSRGRRLTTEARALTRLRSRRSAPPTGPLPGEADAFWQAVRRLPRRQAQAVALRYYSDLPVARVAEAMGCAEGTVKAHLHAARQRLADELGEEEETDR